MSFYNYWGKSSEDGTHLLSYHSLDVAAVAWVLLEPQKKLCKDISTLLEIDPYDTRSFLACLIALHDVGKMTDSFQRIRDFSMYLHMNLDKTLDYNVSRSRHDSLAYIYASAIIQKIFSFASHKLNNSENSPTQLRNFKKNITPILNASFGHHGQPAEVSAIDIDKITRENANCKNAIHLDEFLDEILECIKPKISSKFFQKDENFLSRIKLISWHISGLVSLADWLGSNNSYFPFTTEIMPLAFYWEKSIQKAKLIVKEIGILKELTPHPFYSFKETFGYQPTALQAWAESVPIDNSPQLFILEDSTGSGKTEAALTLAHRLIEEKTVGGFFFGLPTMATSNAMYKRLSSYFAKKMNQGVNDVSYVLAHSASHMSEMFTASLNRDVSNQDYNYEEESILASCNRWFGDSRKKALLAQVTIGTIDQALLSVLAQKYQSLRLIGLFNKVLILDEIHTADSYMNELIVNLIKLHASHGGSMILLTATLSKKQKLKLMNAWEHRIDAPLTTFCPDDFPLATKVSSEGSYTSTLAVDTKRNKSITVRFLNNMQSCIDLVVEKANSGQSVVWIRNTVGEATDAYKLVKKKLAFPEKSILFHSQFALLDRNEKEKIIHEHIGKQSDRKTRANFLIISTQVFQESLDVDVDCMVTDICPIDHLLQRVGRLHRHQRNEDLAVYNGKDLRNKPILNVFAPSWTDHPEENWLNHEFRGTEAVYRSPGRIWLGMKILRELQRIEIPKDARNLIESVYGENVQLPTALSDKDAILNSTERLKTHIANSISLDWSEGYSHASLGIGNWRDDTLEISTRYVEQDSVLVIICKKEGERILPLYANKQLFELSILKLSAKKYNNSLNRLNEVQRNEFIKLYPRAKYHLLWLPDDDPKFTYSQEFGLEEKNTND